MVSVTPQPRFTPGERTPGTHWIGGWMGPRAVWTQGPEEKFSVPVGDRTLIVQPIVRHLLPEMILPMHHKVSCSVI
jgi:hypothetical protein